MTDIDQASNNGGHQPPVLKLSNLLAFNTCSTLEQAIHPIKRPDVVNINARLRGQILVGAELDWDRCTLFFKDGCQLDLDVRDGSFSWRLVETEDAPRIGLQTSLADVYLYQLMPDETVRRWDCHEIVAGLIDAECFAFTASKSAAFVTFRHVNVLLVHLVKYMDRGILGVNWSLVE